MDLHIYTRELLDKHLLPEIKEIAQGLGIVPDGNKTRRETWVAALVGKPFPVFQSLENSLDVDRVEEPLENSPGVDRVEERIEYGRITGYLCRPKSPIASAAENSPGVDRIEEPLKFSPDVVLAQEPLENFPGADRAQEPLKFSPGADRAQEPLKFSPGVGRAQEPLEFSDLESALAEIARLRVQNEKLLELARSQAEKIRLAKDISPVEKPSLKRVLALAQAACLDVFKSAEGSWFLTMGHLKRSFKKLRDIWDLLVSEDWYLMDLFSPPPLPVVKKSIFTAVSHTRYSAIPFCDDNLIDIWSLGVNAASSGRSPPAGGDAM